jgi:hypothetical protein
MEVETMVSLEKLPSVAFTEREALPRISAVYFALSIAGVTPIDLTAVDARELAAVHGALSRMGYALAGISRERDRGDGPLDGTPVDLWPRSPGMVYVACDGEDDEQVIGILAPLPSEAPTHGHHLAMLDLMARLH